LIRTKGKEAEAVVAIEGRVDSHKTLSVPRDSP
jgi:hypothetical protein